MCDSLGWGMIEVMHIVLLKASKAAFVATIFIIGNVNEVMMEKQLHYKDVIVQIEKR
jgi:hypothetical protein